MKKCRNCGFEMADNMNFCPQCHARFETAAHRVSEAPEARNGAGGERLTKAQRDTLVRRQLAYKLLCVFSIVSAVILSAIILHCWGVGLKYGKLSDIKKPLMYVAACAAVLFMMSVYVAGKAKAIQDKLDADDR